LWPCCYVEADAPSRAPKQVAWVLKRVLSGKEIFKDTQGIIACDPVDTHFPHGFPHPSRISSIYFLPAPALPIGMLEVVSSIPSSMGIGLLVSAGLLRVAPRNPVMRV
jgi:hypothetical protein